MKPWLLLTALAMTTVAVSGCAVYPAHGPYYRDEPSVTVAPPPLHYEQPGHPPSAEFIWIAGYWNWAGVRYVWVPGRWEAPRPGLYWVPHRWERDANQWRQHGGRWERDGRPRPAPEALPPRQRPDSHRPSTAPTLRSEPGRAHGPEPHFVPRSERHSHQPSTKPGLSAEDAAKVAKLRADGEAQHKAGKHDDSMKSLGEAKKLLGI